MSTMALTLLRDRPEMEVDVGDDAGNVSSEEASPLAEVAGRL